MKFTLCFAFFVLILVAQAGQRVVVVDDGVSVNWPPGNFMKDGSVPMIGNLDMGTKTVTNAGHISTTTLRTSAGDVDARMTAVSNGVVALQASTALWNQASTDGISATNNIKLLQASTTLWNKASSDGISATNSCSVILTNTPTWSQFVTHTNNGNANILHFTAAEKAVATNAPLDFIITSGAANGTVTNARTVTLTYSNSTATGLGATPAISNVNFAGFGITNLGYGYATGWYFGSDLTSTGFSIRHSTNEEMVYANSGMEIIGWDYHNVYDASFLYLSGASGTNETTKLKYIRISPDSFANASAAYASDNQVFIGQQAAGEQVKVGIGVYPGQDSANRLVVNGNSRTIGTNTALALTLTQGASAGKILTSDSAGNASWKRGRTSFMAYQSASTLVVSNGVTLNIPCNTVLTNTGALTYDGTNLTLPVGAWLVGCGAAALQGAAEFGWQTILNKDNGVYILFPWAASSAAINGYYFQSSGCAPVYSVGTNTVNMAVRCVGLNTNINGGTTLTYLWAESLGE